MGNFDRIPVSNPLASYLINFEIINSTIQSTLNSGNYIHGPQLLQFEQEFANYLNVKEVIGVGNGTDALYLAIRSLDLGAGDPIITVSNTAVATVAAIEMANAIPVLVDISKDDGLMNTNSLSQALGEFKDIKCVIPVHLYGRPIDMKLIESISNQNNIRIIQDCAQAHGARFDENHVSSWGDLSTYSFYPTKNLGCFGDGGAVATNNIEAANKVRLLREYGWKERYISDIPGINSRLDEIQAAILRVKLMWLENENERRREIAKIYNNGLNDLEDLILPPNDRVGNVYHQFVIRSTKRDDLRKWLNEKGVGTLIHYPIPIHQQPAYKNRIRIVSGGLPITEIFCREILSLPIFPQLSNEEVEKVISYIRSFFGKK
jgi:dTDP-4-amino-4,6-dideoxygalactose transaminase